MKSLVILFSFVFATILATYSQNNQTEGNPFARYGTKVPVFTFSGRSEFHDTRQIVEIGTVKYDTRTQKIVEFVDTQDTIDYLPPEVIGMQPDPHAEKYYSISPYAYAMNNPIKFVDPDGRDVFITGSLSNDALKQIQSNIGNGMQLNLSGNGLLCYSVNAGQKLSTNALQVKEIIDNSSTIINLNTIDGDKTSTGNLFVGGAFMGNQVTKTNDGTTMVEAYQEINPKVLGTADSHTGTPGKMTMHELTEAYQGALISQKSGVSSGNSNAPGNIYNQAHDKATPQSIVYERYYDSNNRVTGNINQAVKVEWSVPNKIGVEKVIQTLK